MVGEGTRPADFGRYRLIEKLATGGMAEIWLASQKGLAGFNRFVVIKKILGHLAEQASFLKMFLDEARTSAQLQHPNIAQIHDLGKEGKAYYIAMEYIAGENLGAIVWRAMKKQMPLCGAYAARMIAEAAKALHYAHQLKSSSGEPLQIVHRDVSPQNILVSYDGEVKVVDFGIAKAATRSEHTRTGLFKGKFPYMSPEQCMGKPIDARADIFALGVVLYEIVTGKRLFKHESELVIMEMIVNRPLVPPSEVTDGVSPELEAIILRALEKSPEARFESAKEMQIALEDFIKKERVSATSSDLAGYMRALFHDRIEMKRRLCESAMKSSTSTAQLGRSRLSAPLRPAPAPGATPTPTVTPMPMSTASYASVLAPPRHGAWVTHLAIAVASAIICAGITVIALVPSTEPVPIRRGALTLITKPSGAKVTIDGQPLADLSGKPLFTPVELKNLDYGSTYRIRVERPGEKPAERAIVMSEAVDKKELSIVFGSDAATPEPKARPIAVATEECTKRAGAAPGYASINSTPRADLYVDGERIGQTPLAKKKLPSGCVIVRAVNSESRRERTVRLEIKPGTLATYDIAL